MIDPLLLIRASAGSGKTYSLVVRYLALLLRGVGPQRILASTFTRKAAAEIKQRVFSQLALAAQSIDECERLALAVELPQLTVLDCQIALEKVVALQHRLAISTIDGIAMQIAKCSAAELGLSPRLGILEELNTANVRRAALLRLKTNHDRATLLTIISELLSGQTPSSLTNKLEAELAELLDLAAELPQQRMPTIDALPVLEEKELRLLEQALSEVEVPLTASGKPNQNWNKAVSKLQSALKAQNWHELTEGGLVEAVHDSTLLYHKQAIPKNLVVLIQQIIRHMAGVFSQQVRSRSSAFTALLRAYRAEYYFCLAQLGEYGFSDLKRIVANAMSSQELSTLLFRLDSRFEHVLLDEFQDTSRLDWTLLQPLFDGAASGNDSNRSFLCVGDPKQGIYGWRGGVIEIFDYLISQYPLMKQRELALTRRSSSAITNLINQVFGNLNSQDFPDHQAAAIEQWRQQFPSHSTSRADVGGYVELTRCPEELIYTEAIERVRQLSAAHPDSSIALLFFTNDQISQFSQIAQRLAPELEFSREGKRQLARNPAIRLVLSLLRLIDHPEDTISSYHLSNSLLSDLIGKLNDAQTRAAFSQQARQEIASRGLPQFLARFVERLRATVGAVEAEPLREFMLLIDKYRPHERLSLIIKRTLVCSYAEPQRERIRLMTIHAAKGLEFDRVILPLQNQSLVRSRGRVLVDRADAMSPPRRIICYNNKESARFIPEVVALMRSNEEREVLEVLNQLYVALTRAREELFIFVSSKPKVRTISRLLCNSLAQLSEPDAGLRIGQIAASTKSQAAVKPGPGRLTNRSGKQLKKIKTAAKVLEKITVISASSSASPSRQLERLAQYAAQRSAQRMAGISAHAALQSIEWDIKSIPNLAPDIAELFNRKRYPSGVKIELWRERRFAVLLGNEIVSGRFDRVVLQRDQDDRVIAAEIIDFKFGARAQEINAQLVERHRAQLQLYQRALHSILRDPTIPVQTYLAFIEAGRVL